MISVSYLGDDGIHTGLTPDTGELGVVLPESTESLRGRRRERHRSLQVRLAARSLGPGRRRRGRRLPGGASAGEAAPPGPSAGGGWISGERGHHGGGQLHLRGDQVGQAERRARAGRPREASIMG